MSYEEFDVLKAGDRVKHRKSGEIGIIHTVDAGSYQVSLFEWLKDKSKRTLWRHMREFERLEEVKAKDKDK
jgi:hypothetical protein